MTIIGKLIHIEATDEKIYSLIGNCNHFSSFIPPSVKGWESTENSCKFLVEGIISMEISIIEKIPHSKVKFQADNDKHISMELEISIQNRDIFSQMQITAEAHVPIFLQSMVKKPLQNMVDVMTEQIKIAAEKQ